MGVPFEMLIGYIEEPNLDEIPLTPYEEAEDYLVVLPRQEITQSRVKEI